MAEFVVPELPELDVFPLLLFALPVPTVPVVEVPVLPPALSPLLALVVSSLWTGVVDANTMIAVDEELIALTVALVA